MLGIIEISGKQYCIKADQTLRVPRLATPVGENVSYPNLLGGDTIMVQIVDHILDNKVMSRKFRNKTRYTRVRGHRQPITIVRAVTTPASKPQADEPKPAAKPRARAKKADA